MSGWVKLAWKYVCFHRLKTAILVACVFLTLFLPVAVRILLAEFNRAVVARSDSTPLVIGPRTSGIDLTLQALYFRNRTSETIPFRQTVEVESTGYVKAIPIHSRYTAQTFPVVGTNIGYFKFRELKLAAGDQLAVLGDCVVGATVARRLGLTVGDRLLTDQEATINIAGDYPLKMLVRGILKRAGSPDDEAVFVDLKTAWVIQGLGHGHQQLGNETDGNLVVREKDHIQARAAVRPWLEITDENIDTFHFHGDQGDFPISALIAIAHNEKCETLFMGHYLGANARQIEGSSVQLVEPGKVISKLMKMVFQVKKFFDANALLVSLSTLLLLGLVVLLSQRLRASEMQTMFKLGCSRSTIALLQLGELAIVFAVAIALVAAAIWATRYFADDIIHSFLLG